MARPGFLHLPLQGLKAGVNHTLFFTGVPKYSINLCLLPGAQSVLSVFQQRRCFHIWGAACTLSFPGEKLFSHLGCSLYSQFSRGEDIFTSKPPGLADGQLGFNQTSTGSLELRWYQVLGNSEGGTAWRAQKGIY